MTKDSSADKTKAVRFTKTSSRRYAEPKADQPVRRAFKARSLAALLPAVTEPVLRRHSSLNMRLITDWADIIGPAYAARTRPQRLTAGTLVISCAGPVAMELQYMSDSLISRINTWCGQSLVSRLRFVQDTQPEKPRSAALPECSLRPPPRYELPDMEEGPLRTALEALGARVLQDNGR
ncbi:DciA family protein [Acetobacter sp. DsW_059]|uniref:DciA family protein n=1 Tax=Acetobacter sp. DsW_059 TaxID=1670661 RepID=UPI000A3CB1C9|nr:DciA family protein [Acetobacter sp. DsW_059]OUJ11454.1 hypothetical protein HK25_01030 [Acetobacter sp. DsW_059]